MKITLDHVKRAAFAATAVGSGAYALAAFSPDLVGGSFVQRFHAALVLLLTAAFSISALQLMAAGTSYRRARLLSAPAFLAWATYVVIWRTPTAVPATTAIALAAAVVLSAVILHGALGYPEETRSA
jgi:hypothetical protein